MELYSKDLIWWIIISAMLLTVLILFFKLILQPKKTNKAPEEKVHNILYIGGLACLTGILSQVIGLIGAINAIIEAADVSFGILLNGLKKSFYLPGYGLIVLILSLIFVLLIKNLQKEPVH